MSTRIDERTCPRGRASTKLRPAMSEPTQTLGLPGPPLRPTRGIACALGLLLVVLAAHGISLWDGLFFDDHWHRAAFRTYGWTPHDLVESATIDLSGKLNHLWWQTNTPIWRYPRPVAMLLAKAEFVLSGGNPVIIHACALGWHWLTALLVYWLGLKAGLERRWAFCAGVMFVIVPHSFLSLGWTAARNVVVGTFFFTAAAAAYLLASLGRPSQRLAWKCAREGLPTVLWILALFSRETSIIFPLVILLIDLSYGGRRHFLRRIPYHVTIWLLALAFVAWRLKGFGVGHIPEIYFAKISGVESVPWLASKMLQLLVSQVFYTPMLMGLATYQGLPRGQWPVHAVMAVLIGLIAVWYVAASRGRYGRWLWPLWCVAAFVPVVKVFTMPHFSYLASVPYGVVVAIALSGLAAPWRKTVALGVVAATVWSLFVYRVVWAGIVRSEQLVYLDMRESTPGPPPPGSKLFFINLPIAAIYAPDAMREVWNNPALEGYTLTFAPHPLMMRQTSIVRQLNDHELEISTASPGYFSGLPGKMLLDGMRPDSPLTTGTVVRGEVFDTTVLEADVAGVRKLRFRFHQPLNSEGYYFYVSSPQRAAYRLRFDGPNKQQTDSAELFKQARSPDLIERVAARCRIRDTAWPVAIALASPIQDDLSLQSESSLARVEQWWLANDVGRLAREMADWKARHSLMLRQRGWYFKVMSIVERCVKSDVYLTGSR